MARRPRKTPEQIEAQKLAQRVQDFDAVNLPTDAAVLPRQADIEVTRKGNTRTSDGSKGNKVDGEDARRLDAFSALRSGMAQGAYDAARRFEHDVLVMLGQDGRGPSLERVDEDRPKGRTDRMCAAKADVEAVQDRIPPRDFWLLQELIAPAIDRGTWRDHVKYITGESHAHGQGAAVRAACVNLRDAYTAIERRAA